MLYRHHRKPGLPQQELPLQVLAVVLSAFIFLMFCIPTARANEITVRSGDRFVTSSNTDKGYALIQKHVSPGQQQR